MIARAAGLLLATLLGVAPAGALALLPAGPTQVVPAAQIAALAARVARALVPDASRALAPAFAIPDQTVPAGSIVMRSGSPQVNATYVSVPIAIDIDGVTARTVFTGFRITSYVRLPVAARDLEPGTLVAADDLTYENVPFNGRAGIEIESVAGRRTTARINRGDVLYPELTRVNLIVIAGTPAVFIVHDGPVRLATDVIARTSGGLGEYVTIFDPQTQRALSGVVTGPNTVEFTVPGEN